MSTAADLQLLEAVLDAVTHGAPMDEQQAQLLDDLLNHHDTYPNEHRRTSDHN